MAHSSRVPALRWLRTQNRYIVRDPPALTKRHQNTQHMGCTGATIIPETPRRSSSCHKSWTHHYCRPILRRRTAQPAINMRNKHSKNRQNIPQVTTHQRRIKRGIRYNITKLRFRQKTSVHPTHPKHLPPTQNPTSRSRLSYIAIPRVPTPHRVHPHTSDHNQSRSYTPPRLSQTTNCPPPTHH